jgi:hypothetical protein
MERAAKLAGFLAACCLLSLFWLAVPVARPGMTGQSAADGPLSPDARFEKIVIEKKKRLLTAYMHGKAVRSYCIALGDPQGPKRAQGDKKRPKARITLTARIRTAGITKTSAYPTPTRRTKNAPPLSADHPAAISKSMGSGRNSAISAKSNGRTIGRSDELR